MLLYTSIAINGLLFHYKPTSAVVTVDGKTHPYHHVWLAPTMVMYGKGKLKTLTVFPSIFKGAHIRHNEMVEVLTGHHIHVEFDRPTPPRLTARPSPTSPPMRSLVMAAALPDKDYRSMLNFSIAKGSGSPPDPNIYYRSNFYEL